MLLLFDYHDIYFGAISHKNMGRTNDQWCQILSEIQNWPVWVRCCVCPDKMCIFRIGCLTWKSSRLWWLLLSMTLTIQEQPITFTSIQAVVWRLSIMIGLSWKITMFLHFFGKCNFQFGRSQPFFCRYKTEKIKLDDTILFCGEQGE